MIIYKSKNGSVTAENTSGNHYLVEIRGKISLDELSTAIYNIHCNDVMLLTIVKDDNILQEFEHHNGPGTAQLIMLAQSWIL